MRSVAICLIVLLGLLSLISANVNVEVNVNSPHHCNHHKRFPTLNKPVAWGVDEANAKVPIVVDHSKGEVADDLIESTSKSEPLIPGDIEIVTEKTSHDAAPTPSAHPIVRAVVIDPNHVIRPSALKTAQEYFDSHKSSFKNQKFMAIVDFTKSASQKRFFLINLETGAVEPLFTSHGAGSDPNGSGRATRFSNVANSKMSSLGFYKTAETYQGKHGYSLRMDGLSTTNSNVRARAVVIHEASYVPLNSGTSGRSYGCFALNASVYRRVIDSMKGGAMIYATNQ